MLYIMTVLAAVAFGAPVKLIFDTDIGNDVDDVMALALIHVLEDQGACELLGVTLSTPHKLAAPFVDAVNTFYGRPDIPIGINPDAPDGFFPDKDFLKLARRPDLYPHDFKPEGAMKAVPLLRKLLASADDGSVVIVQVGFFTNLAELLDSKGDAFSPLEGSELVMQKVRLLSLMGGDFQRKRAEYNVRFDVKAARQVAARWPTATVWSGSEIGDAVTFPAESVESDFSYVKNHIVRDAYQLYRPTPHERPCWDLTSVWWAVHPDTEQLSCSPSGVVTVSKTGVVSFVSDPKGGRDHYLTISPRQAIDLRTLFARLVSTPPAKR